MGGEVLSEAIRRMRNHQIIIKEGFDGEYGEVKVFRPDETKIFEDKSALFEISNLPEIRQRKLLNFNLQQYQKLKAINEPSDIAAEPETQYIVEQRGILQGLNPEQAKAVKHDKERAMILAGPGTGKTNVLTRRIAYLVKEKQVNPENILAVTFTNQAAEEMLSRTKKLLGQPFNIENIHISTFHALGYSILRNYYREKNQTNIHIIDDEDKLFMLQYLFPEKKKTEMKHWKQEITEIKQKVLLSDEIKDDTIRNMFERYSAELQKNHLFDFDDMIYMPLLIFRKDKMFLQKLQQRFPWIMVDEYQDINDAQYQLIKTLSDTDNHNITVIGDPNQAIYGFRGSNAKFISRFIEDFPKTAIYKLNLSYRCTNNILKASGNILKENNFLQGLDDGLKIKISTHPTDKSEAEFIAREIENLSGGLRFFSMDSNVSSGEKNTKIESLSDFAILCRTKAQMGALEKALNSHSIPYQKINEDEFLKHNITRVLINLLKLSSEPENLFLRNKITSQLNINPIALDKIHNQPLKLPLDDYLHFLWTEFIINTTDEDFKILDRLKHLAAKYTNDTEGFIKHMTLGQPADLYQPEIEKVSLMTIHAAKGLEFKCVFIAGCENKLIPYSLFKEQKTDNDEEKRLLYVGMTRAKAMLYLTYAKKRFLMGRELQLPKSPFLNLIEKQLAEQTKNDYKKTDKNHGQLSLFG